MIRVLRLLFAISVLSTVSWGQCGSGGKLITNPLTNLPDCTGVAGGTGTVTNIATTTPITGGPVTTTGTLACPTCVTSSSPGVGLAHFPGSSQAVTSSAVVEGDQSLSDITTANVSITKHGYAPKLPNDATKFLDGTGGYSIPPGTAQLHVIAFTIDGGGSAITTGDAKLYPTVAFGCTITRIDISADQSGSVTVDVWKAAGAIPTSGGKISASAPLSLSSAQLAQNGSTSGWSKTVSSGDVFGFNVATATTVTRVIGQIWCQ